MGMNSQDLFLVKARNMAYGVNIWPAHAACEGAWESPWGTSRLCLKGNNLFGEKQHQDPIFDTLTFTTTEHENGVPVTIQAHFVKFPDWVSCFRSRMDTLRRLAMGYPHYEAALDAPSGEVFVREVSQTWSTDPHWADKVMAIYDAHKHAFLDALSPFGDAG
jgi:flagellum-specific peptidoglycan hydrolase FlgJ